MLVSKSAGTVSVSAAEYRDCDGELIIRQAAASELDAALAVQRAAFGPDGEDNLVRALVTDPGAQPLVPLPAFATGRAIGHVLFTRVSLRPQAAPTLAPLAAMPDGQRRGIGSRLVERGFEVLAERRASWCMCPGARAISDASVSGRPPHRVSPRTTPYPGSMRMPGWCANCDRL